MHFAVFYCRILCISSARIAYSKHQFGHSVTSSPPLHLRNLSVSTVTIFAFDVSIAEVDVFFHTCWWLCCILILDLDVFFLKFFLQILNMVGPFFFVFFRRTPLRSHYITVSLSHILCQFHFLEFYV